ncbi:XRE family transcriptional regulator [Candidatus Woesearchaeota archaeon]|nr:MAG: XRE family transcriptional regulator [Candidatus Woesearchaeota archaeon]
MKLNKFLVKAKANTYASSGEGGEKIIEDGSKELSYEEGEFKYRDRYFGFNPFVGEEIVWKKGKVLWAMNYYGKVISREVPAKRIYEFLKEALSRVNEEIPFRGPKEFEKDELRYENYPSGTIEEFTGFEKIFHKGKEVYRLYYHGGLAKTK